MKENDENGKIKMYIVIISFVKKKKIIDKIINTLCVENNGKYLNLLSL